MEGFHHALTKHYSDQLVEKLGLKGEEELLLCMSAIGSAINQAVEPLNNKIMNLSTALEAADELLAFHQQQLIMGDQQIGKPNLTSRIRAAFADFGRKIVARYRRNS